jgi:hypothetical protein
LWPPRMSASGGNDLSDPGGSMPMGEGFLYQGKEEP